MKEKKYTKIILLILLIALIALITFFLYNKKNENIDISDVNENNNTSDIIEDNNTSDIVENDISNTNEDSDTSDIVENNISYIEMTEENYNKYNNNGYLFIIFNMKKNNNKTSTIQGRVYKVRELPTLTVEQYNDLANGETVKIMEFEMKLTSDKDLMDEDGKYAGHDLFIVSENNISFYVSKNDDGTGKLYDAAEIALCDGTDIYMQITLDNNTPTKSGFGNMPLNKYVEQNIEYNPLYDTVVLDVYNTEFTFENGKCTSIFFPSV